MDPTSTTDPSLVPLAFAEWLGRLAYGPKRVYTVAYATALLREAPLPPVPEHGSRNWPAKVRRRVDGLLSTQEWRSIREHGQSGTIVKMIEEAAATGGPGDAERARLERLFINAGYAPPLAPVYALVLRPFDDDEKVSDSVLEAHRRARITIRKMLRQAEGRNPAGGEVESLLLQTANDLLAAAVEESDAAVGQRLRSALERLSSGPGLGTEAQAVSLPTRPESATNDRRGKPIGLWR